MTLARAGVQINKILGGNPDDNPMGLNVRVTDKQIWGNEAQGQGQSQGESKQGSSAGGATQNNPGKAGDPKGQGSPPAVQAAPQHQDTPGAVVGGKCNAKGDRACISNQGAICDAVQNTIPPTYGTLSVLAMLSSLIRNDRRVGDCRILCVVGLLM